MATWTAVVIATLVWIGSAFLLPAEGRWKRALGVLAFGLFVGSTVWLLLFSAGAAVLLAAGSHYLPLGEASTIAGAIGGAIACFVTCLIIRRWNAEE